MRSIKERRLPSKSEVHPPRLDRVGGALSRRLDPLELVALMIEGDRAARGLSRGRARSHARREPGARSVYEKGRSRTRPR